MSRCDSAAMVSKTRELLPEPETPVNTVRRRLGRSTEMSLRLLTRAPWTRIRSWVAAARTAGDCVFGLVAVLIVCPSWPRSPDGSAQLLDADQVAGRIADGAVANAV